MKPLLFIAIVPFLFGYAAVASTEVLECQGSYIRKSFDNQDIEEPVAISIKKHENGRYSAEINVRGGLADGRTKFAAEKEMIKKGTIQFVRSSEFWMPGASEEIDFSLIIPATTSPDQSSVHANLTITAVNNGSPIRVNCTEK